MKSMPNNLFKEEFLQTFMSNIKTVKEYPEGWENSLTSEEFLLEAKKLLKKKFDERNKISSGYFHSIL
jgi:hypothetical protein